MVDDRVLAAAAGIIASRGWAELTLEGVADSAGMSRATLYRRGISREAIASALASRAASGWKSAIWPALTTDGTAVERLALAIRAGCQAIEQFAGILSAGATNPIVDLGRATPIESELGDVFSAPFARLLLDGATDGSIALVADVPATATAIFSILSRSYLALRSGEGMDAARATDALLALVMGGLLPRQESR